MLNKITLENFKAWQEIELNFGKITGIFGTNSSGKSSLFQFFLLLKQTKNAADRSIVLDFGGQSQIIDLGSFTDIVHNHEKERSIKWQIGWSVSQQIKINDPQGKRTSILAQGDKIATCCEVSLNGKNISAKYLEYWIGNQKFSLEPKSPGNTEFQLHAEKDDNEHYKFIRTPGRAWSIPGPVKTHLFPDQSKTYHKNADFLSNFEVAYERLMDNIYYLGPLREFPKRQYIFSGARPSDVGTRGERTIDAILAATNNKETRQIAYKTHRKPFQEIIAYWLKELGLIHEFKIEEIREGSNLYEAKVKRDKNSAEVLLTDVGFGVSQVLPVLVLLYYVPEGATILMEQPEIHLHPSVQSGLADVIVSVSKKRNIQVIVESHSEHLLRRFQRKVAEQESSEEDIRLYFCDRIDGKSSLQDLQLNLYGEIENWPENFFGDEISEIAAIQSASLKRRIENKK